MAGDRELRIRIVGDATSAEAALAKTELASSKVSASSKTMSQGLQDAKANLLGMVPGASNAESALKKMSGASDGTGISLKGALAGGAAAAAVAITAMAAQGVSKFSELTGEVTKFKNVTGASSEESSKFIAIAHGMGVETDVLSAAMFKMGNNIAATPDKFTELGIAIAKNKDGTVDLTGTLGNAAKAWQNSTDAVQRDAIAKAIGGKAGAAIIPILKQGKEAVDEFAASAQKRGEIFTDKDLAQGAEYRKTMRELHVAVGALEVSLGKGLVPAISSAVQQSTKLIDAANSLTQKVGGLGGVFKVVSTVLNPLGSQVNKITGLFGHHKAAVDATKESTGQMTAAEEAYQDAADAVTETEKEQADAYKASSKAIDEHVKSMQDSTKASEDAMGADIAYARALDANKLVTDKVKEAQDKLNQAIKEHGATSAEARQATVDLNGAILDGEETYRTAADRAVDLIAKHHEMAGEAYSAEQKHQDLINKLAEFADQVDGPIHDALERYIAELKSVPSEVRTTIAIEGDDFHVVRRASGGPAGGMTWVGEKGPELVSLPTGSYVHSNSDSRAMMSGGGITVGQIVVQGADDPRATAVAVREELLKLSRRNVGVGLS